MLPRRVLPRLRVVRPPSSIALIACSPTGVAAAPERRRYSNEAAPLASHRIQPPRPPPPSISLPLWKLIGAALGLTALFGIGDYIYERSAAKQRLAARVGFPIDLLLQLKEAREVMDRALLEKEHYETIVRRKREQRRKDAGADEAAADSAVASDSSVPQAVADTPTSVDAISTDEEGLAVLTSSTPSLLEAERIYRQILSRLHFRGIDLKLLHQLVAEGTPTPAMTSVNQTVQPEVRKRVQAQINDMLDPAADPVATDKRVLPYVLSLLAFNLQLQGDILKQHDEMIFGASQFRPAPSSAAHRKFLASESYYLQSLTLYRHHFSFDRRPYAVQVMEQLGSLYFDRGEFNQAEAVWMKSMDLLAAAKRSLQESTAKRQRKPRDDATEEATDDETIVAVPELVEAALPSSYAKLASSLAEKLALVHRTRGEYARSVAWLHDALQEWDAYATQLRAQPPTTPLLSASSSSAPPTPFEIAALPLPRAMHLLTSLSADLYEAKKLDEAYSVAVQSLQVLERLVQLQEAAIAVQNGRPKPKIDETATAATAMPHQAYLTPRFTAQLATFLAQVDTNPSTPLASVPEEAAATFHNLALVLRAHAHPYEAKQAMQRAKEIARAHARTPSINSNGSSNQRAS